MGFFELKEHEVGGPHILTLVLEQQWHSNVVLPAVVEFIKNSKLWIDQGLSTCYVQSFSYRVKYFFLISFIWKLLCCVNMSWSQSWHHKHVIIGLTNKSGIGKWLLL